MADVVAQHGNLAVLDGQDKDAPAAVWSLKRRRGHETFFHDGLAVGILNRDADAVIAANSGAGGSGRSQPGGPGRELQGGGGSEEGVFPLGHHPLPPNLDPKQIRRPPKQARRIQPDLDHAGRRGHADAQGGARLGHGK